MSCIRQCQGIGSLNLFCSQLVYDRFVVMLDARDTNKNKQNQETIQESK